jgi:glycosyltransferase involved in cell wall biosynthesis
MNVLGVTSLYPTPGRSYSGIFNAHQLGALPSSVQLKLITPVPWTSTLGKNTAVDRRVAVNGHPPSLAPRFYYPPKVLRRWHGVNFYHCIRPHAERMGREIQFDAVYGMFGYPDGWGAARLAQDWKAPFVLKLHGSDVHQTSAGWRRRRLEEVISKAQSVVTVSAALAAEVRRMSPHAKVHVVRNGVDLDLFRPGDSEQAKAHLNLKTAGPLLLFVGRLEEVKGADLLPRIARRIRHCVDWAILGDGALSNQIRNRWPSSRVKFLRPRSQRELALWYRAADVVIFPSRNEGIPNALLEALASDRPVVAAPVGGICEIMKKTAATALVTNEPAQFAQAIDELLEVKVTPGTARSLVEGMTWEASGAKLAEVFQGSVRS